MFVFFSSELSKKCQELEKGQSSADGGGQKVKDLEEQIAEMTEEKEQMLAAYNAVQKQQEESVERHRVSVGGQGDKRRGWGKDDRCGRVGKRSGRE